MRKKNKMYGRGKLIWIPEGLRSNMQLDKNTFTKTKELAFDEVVHTD